MRSGPDCRTSDRGLDTECGHTCQAFEFLRESDEGPDRTFVLVLAAVAFLALLAAVDGDEAALTTPRGNAISR